MTGASSARPVSCSSAVGSVAAVCHVRSIVRAVWSAKVVNVRPGPTSTSTRSSLPRIDGASSSARRPSSKSTVDRSCALQYPGRADSAPAHVPVSVATYGSMGSDNVTVPTIRSNWFRIGSIIDEWNACEVWRRRAGIEPRSSVRWIAVDRGRRPRQHAESRGVHRRQRRPRRRGGRRDRRAEPSPTSMIPAGSEEMSRPRSRQEPQRVVERA